jgi:hypothetical protein
LWLLRRSLLSSPTLPNIHVIVALYDDTAFIRQ